MSDYASFIASKDQPLAPVGFEPPPDTGAQLFPFQKACVEWALRVGRASLFLDTGLGKTACQLEWARRVVDHARATGLAPRVLLLAPLAVTAQTLREAEKFGIPDVRAVRSQAEVTDGISVTNYEMLHAFDASAFSGVVLDESSILKAFTGSTKRALVEAFKATPYRLACTATPAPNDHLELGNHAHFLGVMESSEMIARWFLNDTSTFGVYRLKGHAVVPFWDWVSSWARCAGKPSDLGAFPDDGYALPELRLHRHTIDVDVTEERGENLFRMPEMSATSVHKEKKRTAGDRVKKAVELALAEPSESFVIWCEHNAEQDMLEEALGDACASVRGSNTPEEKVALHEAWLRGDRRIFVSKSSIFGMGLNWQHCARMIFVGLSFSYESFYQAVRRCWRFGQARAVDVHVAMASTESAVWDVVSRKADGHESMKAAMFAASRRAQSKSSATATYRPTCKGRLPTWLTATEASHG